MLKLVREASPAAMRQLQILKGICTTLFALVLFTSAGNAVTVDTFNGAGGPGTGTCVSGACMTTDTLITGSGNGNGAAFLIPADFEVSGSGKFFSGDLLGGPAMFSHTFEFQHTVGDTVFSFNTVNTPGDFTGLTFTWFGSGLPLLGLVLDGSTTPVTAAFSMLVSTLLSPEVYSLVVSGKAISTGQYDWSVAAIPVPAALPLFGTGLGILGFLGWRRRRKLTAQAAAA